MRPIDGDALQEKLKEMKYRCRAMISSDGEKYGEMLAIVMKTLDYMPTIAPPSNEPLTLEELREMGDFDLAMLEIKIMLENRQFRICECSNGEFLIGLKPLPTSDYGKTWLAYRHRPEEGNDED